MSTRFLTSGGSFKDGTQDLYVRSIACSTQGPNLPVKTDALGIMQTMILQIADVNGLQAALNGFVTNPLEPGVPFDINQNSLINVPSIHSSGPMMLVTPDNPDGGISIDGADASNIGLNVAQGMRTGGSHHVVEDMQVDGDIHVSNNLQADGYTHLLQNLDVDGDIHTLTNATVDKDIHVGQSAYVTQYMDVGSELHVSGISTLDGDVGIQNNCQVDNILSVGGLITGGSNSNLTLEAASGYLAVLNTDPLYRTHNINLNVLNYVSPGVAFQSILSNGRFSYPLTIPADTLTPLYSGFEVLAGGILTPNAIGSQMIVGIYCGPTGTETSVAVTSAVIPTGNYTWTLRVYAHNNGANNLTEAITLEISSATAFGSTGMFIAQGNQAVTFASANLANVQFRFTNTAVSLGIRYSQFRYF